MFYYSDLPTKNYTVKVLKLWITLYILKLKIYASMF